MQQGARLQTINPHWLWKDQAYCTAENPWECYFGNIEPTCTTPVASITNVTDPRRQDLRCQRLQSNDNHTLVDFRAATMEYFFANLQPLVLQEAQRQIGLLFPGGIVPSNLITVHLRWGDKFWEMDLVPAQQYVEAVQQLLNTTSSEHVHIYLACEDPRAVEAFQQAAPPHWHIYVDRTVAELDMVRPTRGNRASWTTRNTQGRAGLVALGSLLVALEANSFVLTTASNWSRLMNVLRQRFLEQDGPTRMIDLRPGEW